MRFLALLVLLPCAGEMVAYSSPGGNAAARIGLMPQSADCELRFDRCLVAAGVSVPFKDYK
jgi:hypothetical protein